MTRSILAVTAIVIAQIAAAQTVSAQVVRTPVRSPMGVDLDTTRLEIAVPAFLMDRIAPVRLLRPPHAPASTAVGPIATLGRLATGRITVEQNGSTVAVGLPAGPLSLSEPIHAAGSVHLYITLDGTSVPVLPESTEGIDRIGLKLEQDDGRVRLAIDAPGLTGYRLDTGETGSTLWIETAVADSDVATESLSAIPGGDTETVPLAMTDAVTGFSEATVGALFDPVTAPSAAQTVASGASPQASRPVLRRIAAVATHGGTAAIAVSKGIAVGIGEGGERAWNGVRVAAGATWAVTRSATTGVTAFVSSAGEAVGTRLQQTKRSGSRLSVARPELIGALLGLTVATVIAGLSLRMRRSRTDTSAAITEPFHPMDGQPAPQPSAAKVAARVSPSMTGNPAIWAARTLAATGLDAASIARRTGIARDAAVLLVSGARRNVPDPASSSSSRHGGAPGRRSALTV
jgi:hypothetical protein